MTIDLELLYQESLTSKQEEIVRLWDVSYTYRDLITHKSETGFKYIERYCILKTEIAPDLVKNFFILLINM